MKHLLLILFITANWVAKAQQEERPSLYMANPYLYNSACSGFTSGLNVTLQYTNQWMGIEGSPSEISATVHKLLRETNYSMGGIVLCEKAGVSKLLEVELSGTYRFLVTDWTWLSLNVGGGARCIGKDFSLLRQDEDPYFERQEKTEVVVRFRMGAWLRFEGEDFLAFSVRGVGNGHLRVFGHKQATHFYLSGGKRFRTSADRHLALNGMLYVAKYSPFGAVVSPSLQLRKKWELGLSYQTGRMVSPWARLNHKENLFLSCMYTFPMSRLCQAGNASTISLMIGFRCVSSEKEKERIYRNAPL